MDITSKSFFDLESTQQMYMEVQIPINHHKENFIKIINTLSKAISFSKKKVGKYDIKNKQQKPIQTGLRKKSNHIH